MQCLLAAFRAQGAKPHWIQPAAGRGNAASCDLARTGARSGGAPIRGAAVLVDDAFAPTHIRGWTFLATASTDADGTFAAGGVPKLGLRVTVRKRGFAAALQLAVHDAPLDIRLVASGCVRGRVVDRDGRSVAGAHVDLLAVQALRAVEPAVSDADGRFELSAPPVADFRIAAYAGPNGSSESALLRGPCDDVELRLPTSLLEQPAAGASGRWQPEPAKETFFETDLVGDVPVACLGYLQFGDWPVPLQAEAAAASDSCRRHVRQVR